MPFPIYLLNNTHLKKNDNTNIMAKNNTLHITTNRSIYLCKAITTKDK